jgi:long-chain acyl-CoA synthetase
MNELVLAHRFFKNVERLPDKPALLSKVAGTYRPVSYGEMGRIVRNVAAVLDSWGIEKSDRVAIVSDNREEWVMTDMANQAIGAVSVPIYPTLLPVQIKQLLDHSKPRIAFVANQELFEKIRQAEYEFEQIVVFDAISEASEVMTFSSVVDQGQQINDNDPQKFQERLAALREDDLACINYTSGTTGVPKGVMLTQKNFVVDCDNSMKIVHMFESDVFLSFLPLSHVLERMGGYYVPMLLGATIGFAESIEKIVENMGEVRPTILVSVPRLFEKIYATVMSGVQSGSALKRKIFYWALRAGKDRMNAELGGPELTSSQRRKIKLADKLVFGKLQAKTGGRLKRFISGGAPLSREIAEFFFCAGLKIYEGYGLTETSPVITVNGPGNVRLGSVGIAIPDTEFEIAQDGEILVKGPQVMQGYYLDDAATREVIDPDGYLHTGDIGHFDDDGFLFITDRKKNIIVTAGGKNVAPQPIEESLKLSPFIAESVIVGDRRHYLTALIVLNYERVKLWAEQNQLAIEPYSEFVKHPKLLDLIKAEVNKQTTQFSRFETIKKFRIIPAEFTIDTGELTPSLKVRRKIVLEKYSNLVDELYLE